MRAKRQGFTLLEILIALSIFAIMSLVISSVLYTVFQTRDRVNLHANRLSQLQFAIIIMQRDFEQSVVRPITDSNGQTVAALTGGNTQVELTRAGFVNPLFQEQRSTLQRIAYQASNNSLIRQTWPSLDRTHATQASQRQLLDTISQLRFSYLNSNNRFQDNWSSITAGGLPRAIAVTFQIADWGKVDLLFAIPAGMPLKRARA